MKLIYSLLLSLLMVEAAYAGGRLADIRPGDSCDRIPEMEQRLGSRQSAVDDAKGITRYQGTHGGKAATIVYRCADGLLDEQTITVQSASREEAHRFASAQTTALSQRLGEPIHDGLELSRWKQMLYGFIGSDLDYLTRVVVWGRAKEDTMLLVTEKGANQWEVTVSQGGSKTEYIFNS